MREIMLMGGSKLLPGMRPRWRQDSLRYTGDSKEKTYLSEFHFNMISEAKKKDKNTQLIFPYNQNTIYTEARKS